MRELINMVHFPPTLSSRQQSNTMEQFEMRTIAELESRLATPSDALIGDMDQIGGDLIVLGASGKLGPSLVSLAVNAIREAGTGATVYAVSRYGTAGSKEDMERRGAVAISADVSDDRALAAIPDAANVVYLVGAKFGTSGNAAGTWETNAYLPGRVARRFATSRISALSTGNVYPFLPAGTGGATEATAPEPRGEYAMSCLGRERVLESATRETGSPLAIVRLNYAVELRYGVLVDIASAITTGTPVDVGMGSANVVWQGYANEATLRSLRYANVPPFIINVAGPETISIRHVAEQLSDRLGKPVEFAGEEGATALLSNGARGHALFGYPELSLDQLIEATADWFLAGGELLGKPTKFQQRDGRF
jgi:nucleoside-diphosphate-sugar epimerase